MHLITSGGNQVKTNALQEILLVNIGKITWLKLNLVTCLNIVDFENL